MQCNANGLSSRSKYYYDIKTNVKKINKLFTNVFQKIVPFSQLTGVCVCVLACLIQVKLTPYVPETD